MSLVARRSLTQRPGVSGSSHRHGTSEVTWGDAISHCYRLEVGGRRGWRLPTIEELASLVDTSQPAPTLPAGNPFSNVQSFVYWSATTTHNTSVAWNVNFATITR